MNVGPGFNLKRLLSQQRDFERELDEELDLHLELETRKLADLGLSPEAAQRQARINLGSLEAVKEECRDQQPWTLPLAMVRDLRLSFRRLYRFPLHSLGRVLVLAVGVATALVLLTGSKKLLYVQASSPVLERLVMVDRPYDGEPARSGFTVGEFQTLVAKSSAFSQLLEYHSMWFDLDSGDPQERASAGVVATGFFRRLGIQPLVGSLPSPLPKARTSVASAGDPPPPWVLLSYDYWQRRWGGSEEVVGTVVRLSGQEFQVAGVLPRLAPFPERDDVWVPLEACRYRQAAQLEGEAGRDAPRMLQVLGILRAETTPDQASGEVGSLLLGTRTTGAARVESVVPDLSGDNTPSLYLLLVASVLVVAGSMASFFNVGLTQLGRRAEEMATRMALGASPLRLTTQQLMESGTLAVLAGGLGVLLAHGVGAALAPRLGLLHPALADLALPPAVVAAVLLAALAVVVAEAVVGIGNLCRRDLCRDVLLKPSWRRPFLKSRALFLAAEIALACVLLSLAGVLTRDWFQVEAQGRYDEVLALTVHAESRRYTSERHQLEDLLSVLRRVDALSAVVAAAWVMPQTSTSHPGQGQVRFELELADEETVTGFADRRVVSPDYFRVVEIPLLAGRLLDAGDDWRGQRVALINTVLARRLGLPPHTAPGRRITLDGGRSWRRLVGVVEDHSALAVETGSHGRIFVPLAQATAPSADLLVRSAAKPEELAQAIRVAVEESSPHLTVGALRAPQQLRREALAPSRLLAQTVSLFALLTLLPTVLGIASMAACEVAERRHEIGIRRAIGARATHVLELIARPCLLPALLGLVVGLPVAALAGRGLSAAGPSLTDPSVLSLAAAAVLSALCAGCALPAWRALKLRPSEPLRYE